MMSGSKLIRVRIAHAALTANSASSPCLTDGPHGPLTTRCVALADRLPFAGSEDSSLDSARRLATTSSAREDEVGAALGTDSASLKFLETDLSFDIVPFATDLLRPAAAAGMMLGFRLARDADVPSTLLKLASLAAGTAPAPADVWFASEPFAARRAKPDGRSSRSARFAASRNRTYERQNDALNDHARRIGIPAQENAIEIAYDALLHAAAHGARLLADDWDWSRSVTTDGALVVAGNSTSVACG